jgi:steroid delta-isomerase-like uncharacterized protein
MSRTIAVTGMCLVMLLITSSAKAEDSNVAENWIEAWNSHDVARVLAVFTPDVFYEDLSFGVRNHGSAQLRAFAVAIFTAVPDVRFELLNSSLRGRHGTIEWVFSGTDIGLYKTHRRFSGRGVSVIEVHGQLISRNSDYYDLATILRQLGLLPPGL